MPAIGMSILGGGDERSVNGTATVAGNTIKPGHWGSLLLQQLGANLPSRLPPQLCRTEAVRRIGNLGFGKPVDLKDVSPKASPFFYLQQRHFEM